MQNECAVNCIYFSCTMEYNNSRLREDKTTNMCRYVYNRYYADLVGTSSVMSLDRFEKRGETSPDAPLGGKLC